MVALGGSLTTRSKGFDDLRYGRCFAGENTEGVVDVILWCACRKLGVPGLPLFRFTNGIVAVISWYFVVYLSKAWVSEGSFGSGQLFSPRCMDSLMWPISVLAKLTIFMYSHTTVWLFLEAGPMLTLVKLGNYFVRLHHPRGRECDVVAHFLCAEGTAYASWALLHTRYCTSRRWSLRKPLVW